MLVSDLPTEDFGLDGPGLRELVRRLADAEPQFDPRAHIAAHHDATWTLTSVTGPVSTIAQRDATGVSHRSSSSLVLIPADALLPDPAPGPGEPSAR